MEKKIYLFCAALAALATFNSCTSDDEIVENTIPEQPVEVKGEPISFTATINDGNSTRANVAGTLNGFTLWGVQNNAVSTPTTGLAYAYDGDLNAWVNADAPTYDTGESPVPYYFYAMALGNTSIAPDADGYDARNNAAKANAVTFTEDGASTNTKGEINIKGEDTNNTPLMLSGGTYAAKSFTYTMPTQASPNTSYIDLENQEDLLVAHNFGTSDAGWTKETVPLTFMHALANFELYLAVQLKGWRINETDQYDFVNSVVASSGVFAVIKSITIRGLKKTGTYTFSTGWSNPDGIGEIKIEYPDGLFIYGACYQNPEGGAPAAAAYTADSKLRRAYEKQFYTPITNGTNSIMVVPQGFASWDPDVSISDCYIEIEGEVFYDAVAAGINDDGWEDENKTAIETWIRGWKILGGDNDVVLEDPDLSVSLTPLTDFTEESTSFSSYYIPFSTPNNIIEPGKRYPFYIDLFRLRYDDGSAAVQGIGL